VQLDSTDVSLELLSEGRRVFASRGRWLHPLLELEEFLRSRPLDRRTLSLRDKIVGRAAALLIVRLGIPEVHAGILSRCGEAVFRERGVRCTRDSLVDRIACRTEDLLADVSDPEAAHAIIVERARASRSAAPSALPGSPA
jgi:hypothetical protein